MTSLEDKKGLTVFFRYTGRWLYLKHAANFFFQINECPLANLDESIHISSDFSDSELEALREFFLSGEPPPKPESPEGGDSLELLFKAMGLDLNNIMASFKDSTAFKYDGDTHKRHDQFGINFASIQLVQQFFGLKMI